MINHELETGVTESARRINNQELREFGDNAPFVCLFSGGKDSGLAISIAQDKAPLWNCNNIRDPGLQDAESTQHLAYIIPSSTLS